MSENEMQETDQLVENCAHCSSPMDVTGSMPLANVICPACGGANRVRTKIQHYIIDSVLGSGGMGVVYKAFDTALERHVALKVIRQDLGGDPEQLALFEEEARLTALVNHPNVVRVFSFGSDHGLLFLAMELVECGTLNDLLELQGKMAEVQAVEVGIQIAKGLQAAYQCGLLHRDIKPGNILFMNARLSKIVDFGLAQFMQQQGDVESCDEVWGSSYYIPPERLKRQPEDLRSDMYSLGATLFHAIAGRPPYEGESANAVALKHVSAAQVNLQTFAPDVSSPTAFVINKMLAKDPADRYQDYQELVDHLTFARDKLRERPAASAVSQPLVIEDSQTQKITVWIIVAALALTLICASGLLFMYFGKNMEGGLSKLFVSDERRYEDSRALILKGDYAGASRRLAAVCAAPKLPQPLGRWAYLHWAMATFLEGKVPEAKQIAAKLQALDLFSSAKEDLPLANFFVESGRVLAEERTTSPGMVRFYKSSNYEAMGLLLFGIKNLRMGKPADAKPFLTAFLQSAPDTADKWIEAYKPLAQKLLQECESGPKAPSKTGK